MPRKRYSTEQNVTKLRQAEVELGRGLRTPQVCKKLGVSEQTYYRWRKEYGGLRLDQAKRLKALEQENTQLKKLVADQALDNMRGGPHPLDRFSSQLRWNPVHDSSGFVCWLSSSPSVSVRLLRRPVIERRVGPAPVVEVHPPTDAGPSLGTGCELGQVDAFVLERSPQPLVNTLSIQRPLPSIEMQMPASLSTSVKSTLVNWLPWSLLKISGGP